MKDTATLISAIADFVGAVAWPFALLWGLLAFRKEFALAMARLPSLLDRAKSLKILDLEVTLESVAEEATREDGGKRGEVSQNELFQAGRIKAEAAELGEKHLLAQMDRLCLEYDSFRRRMPSGGARTRAMSQIVVQMRMLGPSVSDHIDAYKSSGSPGSRLAAVAMMQIQPEKADLDWLVQRFRQDAPFVFYHAALALQNLASNTPARLKEARRAAATALDIIRGFPGDPDVGTMVVLEALLAE